MSDLQPGTVFGRDFRIVKSLRAGGMGAVYIADQISTGKQRALKIMAPELASDPATRERFVLEARAASKIDSDHVVEIVTAGVDEETGSPFLVMELLKGEELADCLVRVGPLPLGDVAEIFQQIGHALEQAHAQGIVHRDLKPENIFLAVSRRRESAFTAKILDFGIAKLVADSKKTGTQPLGSPLFMSPEQTDSKGRITAATDVWALGLIAFRLLTGRDFWVETDSLPMLLREMCVNDIPFASERAKELELNALPHGFDAWFARCVNRDIDARFPEAGEAVRAFAELVDSDAPRGAVVIVPNRSATGMIGTGSTEAAPSVTARTALSDPPPSGVQVRPAGTGDTARVSVGAATIGAGAIGVAVTGEPLTSTQAGAPLASAQKASGARVAVIGVGAAVALAAIGWMISSGKSASTGGATTASPVTTTSASPSAAPLASAAVKDLAACPSGMVLIPGGKMFMGARDLDDGAGAKPPHEVTVTGYCLDKTEVTTSRYQACVDRGECERALEQVSWPNLTDEKKKRYSPFCNANHKERGDHPINCVAWPMADNYCRKNKLRLPTEAEWEFAARGSSQRKYPWGDEAPSGKFLNACGKECSVWGDAHAEAHKMMYDDDDGFPATAPVGSFPAGASAQGVMDLAGNVWEWTSDWYAPYSADAQKDPKGAAAGDKRVVRGGDYFGFQADWARPAWRWKTDPETYNHAIGFRCAADPG